MYKLLIRPFLFLFDPEKVHYFTFSIIRFLNKIGFSVIFKSLYEVNDSRLEREVFGLKFKNPVGLAAGFDKDAKLYQELSNLGFGFIEIGTLTPKGQEGNPKKRLFRLKEDSAIINRMGFNNGGVLEAVERLKRNNGVLIGGNIGKNKVTPNNEAVKDYEICFEALFPHVDYFVVNVSSPNTPGLRELQEKEALRKIFSELQLINQYNKPILLKIAPDLEISALDDIIALTSEVKIDGLVSSNTTLDRCLLTESNKARAKAFGAGGLSGQPLLTKSNQVLEYLYKGIGNRLPIIASGGIFKPEDAKAKLDAGASLVQVWTGFIYEGPGIVKNILQAIKH